MSMTPEQIAAERERFVEACPEFPQTKMAVFGDPQFMFSHTRVAERAWMKRAAIAHAEQAEQKAEIDRLRERVRELAKNELYTWLQASYPTAKMAWKNAPDRILGLAHEVGVWFDDDGNEVPLETWKGMVGT